MKRGLLLALLAIATIVAILALQTDRHGATPAGVDPSTPEPPLVPEGRSEEPTAEPSAIEPTASRLAAAGAEDELVPASHLLVVRVVDELARPLPDCALGLHCIDAIGSRANDALRQSTDAAGECRFDPGSVDGDLAETWVLFVRPPAGYLGRRWTMPSGTRSLEIPLTPAARLWGRVHYADGSLPSADASLRATLEFESGPSETAHADVIDGTYDFGFEIGGKLKRLELESPGNPPAHLELFDLVIAPGADARRDFVFGVGPRLELVFRDLASGEPVEGVQVRGLQRDDARSDATGVLVLDNALEAGKEQRVRAMHADYATLPIDLLAPDASQALRLEFELERAMELSGLVVDMRGVPQPDTLVSCSQVLHPPMGSGTTVQLFRAEASTDAAGRFRLRGIPPRGDFDVSFAVRLGTTPAHRVVGFESVTMPEAAQKERWVLPDLVAIAGRVVDAEGEPASRLEVVAQPTGAAMRLRGETDEAGRFRIEGALPGPWSLSAAHGPRTRVGATIEVRQRTGIEFEVAPIGDTQVELRLAPERAPWPQREVRLHVIDAASGQAVERVDWIFWTGADNDLAWHFGARRLVGDPPLLLPIGAYYVSVGELGYVTAGRRIELEPGEGVQELEVRLVPGH